MNLVVFSGLKDLVLLDLNLNSLRRMDSQSFAGLNLEYLFLENNPSIQLPDNGFNDLSAGVIQLKGCQLTEIKPTFFTPLIPSLRKLFISDNKISRFSPDMLSIFEKLESVRISNNPLICDCQSRWLMRFYYQNPVTILGQTAEPNRHLNQPRCSGPQSVAGEFFNHLTVESFSCEKPVLDSEITLTKDKGVLVCKARSDPPSKISWFRPNGVIEHTFPTADDDTRGEIEITQSDPQVHGTYRCVAINEAGNTSLTVNITWPFHLSGAESAPCADSTTKSSTKEILVGGGARNKDDTPSEESAAMFKKKYFTLIDIIGAVFGTFAGTLVITVLVLHCGVYRKRKSSSQYSTPPQSEYSNTSIKNETVYPNTAQQHNMQIHTMQQMQMPNMHNRPLPTKPYNMTNPRGYDENHYMATEISNGDVDGLVHSGHHNPAALVTPISPSPCQACQTMNHTMNAQHHHSESFTNS